MKVHTKSAAVADSYMVEARVCREDTTLKIGRKAPKLFYITGKKVKTSISNNDQAGSALANTLKDIVSKREEISSVFSNEQLFNIFECSH